MQSRKLELSKKTETPSFFANFILALSTVQSRPLTSIFSSGTVRGLSACALAVDRKCLDGLACEGRFDSSLLFALENSDSFQTFMARKQFLVACSFVTTAIVKSPRLSSDKALTSHSLNLLLSLLSTPYSSKHVLESSFKHTQDRRTTLRVKLRG